MTRLPLPFVSAIFSDPSVTRVGLDWAALPGAGVTASLRQSVGPVDPDWFTPWHVDPAGGLCDYHAPAARPLRVGEAGFVLDLAVDDHARRTAALAKLFAAPVPHVLVLSWELPSGVLVLDGNHRVVLASRLARRVALVDVRLSGPCDPALLPDLVHHLPGLPSQRPASAPSLPAVEGLG